MSKLYFCNNSVFDVESALIFGVSAKDTEEAVGKFGTGFKYAVSMILEAGGSITVYTPEKVYKFTTGVEDFRGKEQKYVLVNGERSTFCTNLGRSWEPWMAYRELRCNCYDEGGEIMYNLSEYHDYGTVIEVECDFITETHENADQFFIETKPVHTIGRVELHPLGLREKGMLFYQGILVSKTDNTIPFHINFKYNVDLTEDRTLKYDSWEKYNAIQNILSSSNKSAIYDIMGSENIYVDKDTRVGETFFEVASAREASGSLPTQLSVLLQNYRKDNVLFQDFVPTKVQMSMVDRAFKFLVQIGVGREDYPIRYVKGMGSGVMGLAKDGTIFLSEIPFNMGTKQVASTILEEWVHNKFGCKDFDRDMQNYLFDKIMSLCEEINAEAM